MDMLVLQVIYSQNVHRWIDHIESHIINSIMQMMPEYNMISTGRLQWLVIHSLRS